VGTAQIPKQVSWAQVTAQRLENHSLGPYHHFQLKKGVSPPFLTSKYVEKVFF
jgi:hypothetical protein